MLLFFGLLPVVAGRHWLYLMCFQATNCQVGGQRIGSWLARDVDCTPHAADVLPSEAASSQEFV